MSDFTKLAVGSPLPFNAPGEICFTMSGGTPTLVMQLPGLTTEEIQAVTRGKAHFKSTKNLRELFNFSTCENDVN